MIFQLFLAGIILVLLYVLLYKKSSRYMELGKKLPGPSLFHILRILLLFAREPLDSLNILHKEIKRYNYGPFAFWLGNDLIVFTSNPEDFRVLLHQNNTQTFPKSIHYSVMHPFTRNGLFTNNDFISWKANRKNINSAFNLSTLKSFVSIFFEESSILVDKITPGVETNVLDKVKYCALDCFSRTSMGVKIHSQKGEDIELLTAVEKGTEIAHIRIFRPWLFNDTLFKWSSLWKEHEEIRHKLINVVDSIIKDRKEQINMMKLNNQKLDDLEDPGSFINIMLSTNSDDEMMNDAQLRDESLNLLSGGLEATSIALVFSMVMLALHQDIQSQVLDEIDQVFQGDKKRTTTFEDIQQLHMLERVIKETLRLYPSTPLFSRCLTGEVQIGKYTLPKGSTVVMFPYAMHRNPDLFPNPNEFNPDNFLTERCHGRAPFAYMPFSAGLRNCIGQKYVFLKIKTILSTILRNYRISSAGSIKQMKDIKLTMKLTLKPKSNIMIVFKSR